MEVASRRVPETINEYQEEDKLVEANTSKPYVGELLINPDMSTRRALSLIKCLRESGVLFSIFRTDGSHTPVLISEDDDIDPIFGKRAICNHVKNIQPAVELTDK
jgi:hypothetical protein